MGKIIQQIKEKEYDIIDDLYSFEGLEQYSDADAITAAEEAFMIGYLVGEEDECAQ